MFSSVPLSPPSDPFPHLPLPIYNYEMLCLHTWLAPAYNDLVWSILLYSMGMGVDQFHTRGSHIMWTLFLCSLTIYPLQ